MLHRFISDDRGNIAILFAGAFSLGVVAAAFAVDEASLYLERRELQTAVDLAALTAARDPANARTIVHEVLDNLGITGGGIDVDILEDAIAEVRLVVDTGHYRPDPNLQPTDRFTVDEAPTNAVRVRYRQPGRQFFSAGWSPPPDIAVAATAAVTPQVTFSIGSRLARLEGGIANLLLNRLLGTEISGSLIDYEALLDVDVSLFGFMDELATALGVTAGTYDDLLAAEARHGAVAAALARLLNGDAAATAMAVAATSTLTEAFPVGRLVDLGRLGALALASGSGSTRAASVGVLELLTASAALANGTSQATASLTAGIPGLTGIAMQLAIGEPPQSATWFAIGPSGTLVRTSQVRLRLRADLLGGSALLNAGVRLPLGLDVAYAQAAVLDAACPSGSSPNGSATIAARPGIARLFIGETVGTTGVGALPTVANATIVDAVLLDVTGRAVVDIGQTAPTNLTFSSSEIREQAVKTASTTTIVGSLAASMIDDMDLDIRILGLGLGTRELIGNALRSLLLPVAPLLDQILADVLALAGLSLGEVDVRVHDVTCPHAVLVG